jgi:hypothetical protein
VRLGGVQLIDLAVVSPRNPVASVEHGFTQIIHIAPAAIT